MKWCCGISLLLYPLISSHAATIHLSGIVTDEHDRFVEGAEVSLYSRNSLKTYTDISGGFELTGDTDGASIFHKNDYSHRHSRGNGRPSHIQHGSDTRIRVSIHDFKGRKVSEKRVEWYGKENEWPRFIFTRLTQGLYLISVCHGEKKSVFRYIVPGRCNCPVDIFSIIERKDVVYRPAYTAQTSEFSDILVVSADGKQTVRRAVTAPVESDIAVTLMPAGVGYVTPSVPVCTDMGGVGDVTTYGSVTDPEYSEGGACNYGATKIRYYAAINVNRIPGDGMGDWREGRCCGRCARVRIHTADGEERTTVVRIVDRCADENCGIDLGGAPAAVIMKDQPGRYSGEWEWVNCDDFEGVSDGSASIYVKEGSNEWWSLVQVRNGPGAASTVRVRKAESETWQDLSRAAEAENFFSVPTDMLQDSDEWDMEVVWETGSSSSLRLPGNKLSLENTSYQFR